MSSVVKKGSWSNTDAASSILDEKKRKRMISNRESARRSRMKKQKHIECLLAEKSTLERKIQEDNEKKIAAWQSLCLLDSENKNLRDEKNRLAEYLKHLHQILDKFRTYESDNNLQVQDTFLKPRKVPIITSGTFTY